jgi:peptide/nickel transport system substrate-binding protein
VGDAVDGAVGDNGGMTRRTFLGRGAATTGALALGAAGLAAGSSGGPAWAATRTSGSRPGFGSGSPRRGGSATVGIIADIDGFYPPANHWDTNGFLYANTIYDPLMAVAADGTVQPYLAQSMTPNATYTEWTMTLRPGIVFSDGSALTSAVVKANYDALDASLLTGQALKGVTGLATPDDLTVVYSFSAPRPRFPASLTTQIGYVVGQAMIDQASSGNGAPTPVGTGPFVYSSWVPNSQFVATRNPHYWRKGYPYLDQITYKPIPDDTQRAATLQSGGVDLIITTDPQSFKQFTGNSQYQVVDSLTKVIGEPTVAFIMLNTAVAPTNDLRVRQALAKALDVSQVLKIFGGGYTKPINGLFLPGSEYYANTGYPTYNLNDAKALVKQYKAQHGTPKLQLTTVPDPRLEQVVAVIQQMWNQAGFDISIGTTEQATLITDFIEGKYQAATSYQFGAVDPDINYVWFSTTTVAPPGSIALNFARNSDPQIEAALQAGRVSTTQAARVAAYRKLNRRLAADLPYLWLEQYPFAAIGAERIQNFAGLTLPNGAKGYGFDEGIMFPTQIWLNG